MWTGLNWLRIGSSDGFLWMHWQIFRFLKSREFLGQLNKYQLLKEDYCGCGCFDKALFLVNFNVCSLGLAFVFGQVWKWNDWFLGYLMVFQIEWNVWHCITVHKCGGGCGVEAVSILSAIIETVEIINWSYIIVRILFIVIKMSPLVIVFLVASVTQIYVNVILQTLHVFWIYAV
jgi:hypothetical protein